MFRRAFLIALALGNALPAMATPPNVITDAQYSEPTSRYLHGVFGNSTEWGTLNLTVDTCAGCDTPATRQFTLVLPQNRVFEDTAPRIVDVAGDGSNQVMVVETDIDLGARLALYDETGLFAATPFIGRTNRWLAPIGVADLDGDGATEVAYVDRPHLAKLIRVWRYENGALTLAGELPGFTNHRFGEPDIVGGIRNCGTGPEMIVADSNWQDIYAVTFDGKEFSTQKLGPHQGRQSFQRALNCKI